jgi:ATP-dependent DNA ligase
VFNWTQLLKVVDYKPGKPARFYQTKYDGIRLLVRRKPDGSWDAWTRNGLTNHWPALEPLKASLGLEMAAAVPAGTALDCELYVPGDFATNVITHIKAGSDKLRLACFAVPWFEGVDHRAVDWMKASRKLIGRVPIVATWPIFPNYDGWLPNYEWREARPAPIQQDWIARQVETALATGAEGVVAKWDHYEGWYKIKPVQTVDAVVTGYKISDSDSFAGGLKAVLVSVYKDGKPVQIASVGSGFEVEFRMSCKPAELVGRVCEVSYDSLAGKGKLKFPRFVRWRDDKLATECLYDQVANGESEA